MLSRREKFQFIEETQRTDNSSARQREVSDLKNAICIDVTGKQYRPQHTYIEQMGLRLAIQAVWPTANESIKETNI